MDRRSATACDRLISNELDKSRMGKRTTVRYRPRDKRTMPETVIRLFPTDVRKYFESSKMDFREDVRVRFVSHICKCLFSLSSFVIVSESRPKPITNRLIVVIGGG